MKLVGIIAVLCSATISFAQDASSTKPISDDQLRTTGGHSEITNDGLRLSDSLVLNPKFALEGGYTSNVFFQDRDEVGAGIVRAMVALELATPDQNGDNDSGPENYKLRAGLQAAWDQYLTSNQFARDQSDISINGNVGLVLFPKSDLSLVLQENYARNASPTNFVSGTSLARHQNALGARLRYRPNQGPLSFAVGYQNVIDDFVSTNSDFASRIQHGLGARVDWEFLPFSTVFLDATYGFYSGLGSFSQKRNNQPLRVRLGIQAPLTESFALGGYVGYGRVQYDGGGSSFNGILGGVSAKYRYTETGALSLSYNYGFEDSVNADLHVDHNISATLRQQIERVVIDANGSFIFRNYSGILPQIGAPSRDDVILGGTLRVHYIVRDWMAVSARLNYSNVATNYLAQGDDPSFSRIDLIAGVAMSY